MKNKYLMKVLNVVTSVGVKHGSTILTMLAVGGVIATAILSSMARPKADDAIEKAEGEKADKEIQEAEKAGKDVDLSQVGKLTFFEKVKASWKCYILTTIMGVLTVACIVGGHVISLRKIGDLAATCNVLQMANDRYERYAKEVKEELGEEKEAELRKKADEKASKECANYIEDIVDVHNADVILTGDGNTLIWDPYAGRYFRSSKPALEMAAARTNQKAMQSRFPKATMEDLYMEAHIPTDKIPKMANALIWNVEESLVEICLSDADVSDFGEPYLIMEFRVEPDVNPNVNRRIW